MTEKKPDSKKRKLETRRPHRLSSSALGPPGFALGPVASGSWPGVPSRMLPAAVPASPADSLLVVLWRSRGVMLLCLLAAVGSGVAYIQLAPPICNNLFEPLESRIDYLLLEILQFLLRRPVKRAGPVLLQPRFDYHRLYP